MLRERPRSAGGYTDLPNIDPRANQYTSAPPTSLQNPPLSYNSPPPTNSYDQYRNTLPPTSALPPLGEAPLPNYGVQPVSSQPPQLPLPQRPWNQQYPEPRTAGLPPTNYAATTNSLQNPGIFPTSPLQQQQDRPWGPLLFVTFALFFSIGGNLYLAYTALEFHSRYRNAIERLRSAARSP
ncbi:MAG: hypothetical protein JF612_08475 [Planctomycetia bacterium]|nr:hypothetical protein [Planctomycetia bacterium]